MNEYAFRFWLGPSEHPWLNLGISDLGMLIILFSLATYWFLTYEQGGKDDN